MFLLLAVDRETMSLAADTRQAVREHPFLYEALRAGVVNYTAAARFLDVGDEDAVVAALRRYAEDLPVPATRDGEVRVTMHSGVEAVEDAADPLLSVGGTALATGGGDGTAVVATGDVDATYLRVALGRLAAEDVAVSAAGVADGAAVVVVGRRDGADAVRALESVG